MFAVHFGVHMSHMVAGWFYTLIHLNCKFVGNKYLFHTHTHTHIFTKLTKSISPSVPSGSNKEKCNFLLCQSTSQYINNWFIDLIVGSMIGSLVNSISESLND